MSHIYLLGACAAKWAQEDIGTEYRNSFNWGEGRRLPDESKIVHIVCDRALRGTGLTSVRSLGERVGIVLGGCFGGLASYERFRAGLGKAGELQPLAFSFSLPCIPASVLSLYYGITGPVVSLSTVVEGGGTSALSTSIGLLQSGLCDHVVVGTWYFPSDTALQCTGLTQAMAAIAILSSKSEQLIGSALNIDSATTGAQFNSGVPGITDSLLDFLSFRSSPDTQCLYPLNSVFSASRRAN